MNAVDNIQTLMLEVVKWLQVLAVPAAAIAFCIGGVVQITGGAEGARKARPWYVGAAIGLVVVLGATALAGTLSNTIKF
ncbi:MAG: hypothetical protein ACRC68_19005 [Clostridium sp.]